MTEQMDLFAASTKRGPGRPKKTPAIRMYFAGYLHPGEDDDLIAWYQSLPEGRRFATLVAILRSGGGLASAVADDSEAEALAAANEIIDNFLV